MAGGVANGKLGFSVGGVLAVLGRRVTALKAETVTERVGTVDVEVCKKS